MSAEVDVALADFTSVFSLHGKVAVVTGGSRGLGLHAASGLLQAGCSKVFITARKVAECEAACKALNSLTNKCGDAEAIAVPADVSKASEISRLVEQISKITDHVDILFANAGTAWGAYFDQHPEEGLDKTFNVNVKSVFLMTQKLMPLLTKSATAEEPSRVLITGSIAGIGVGTLGEQATYGYSLSKAAVMHLARNLAVELGPRHILVNSIAPGLFPSTMTLDRMNNVGGIQKVAAEVPNRRLGRAEDIAALVVFLSGRGASHITGETIVVDGGNIHTRSML